MVWSSPKLLKSLVETETTRVSGMLAKEMKVNKVKAMRKKKKRSSVGLSVLTGVCFSKG